MRFLLCLFIIIQTVSLSAKDYYPDHSSIQYAGNIGFISVGGGYDFFNEKLGLELFYGYAPKSVAGLDIHSMTFKVNYSPWHININEKIELRPFNIGIGLTYNFGDNYFINQSSHYPDNYYKSNAIYFTPYLGLSILYKNSLKLRAIEFYTELGTVDKYLRDYLNSAFEEYYVDLEDIINISFGFRVYF